MRLPDIQQLEMIDLHPLSEFLYGNVLARARRAFFMIMARNTTERFVINQLFDIRIRSAHAAVGVLLQLDEVEGHVQGVVEQELSDQWFADAKQDLQGFGCLEGANRTGQYTEHSTFRAGGDEPGRWRFREETAITWSFFGVEHTYLSIEAIDRNDQPMASSRAMIRGKALNASGSLMVMNHEYARAPVRLEESLALFGELGPVGKQGMAYALLRLGASLPAGESRAGNLVEQSLALFRELGDKFGIAECLMLLSGQVASLAGSQLFQK